MIHTIGVCGAGTMGSGIAQVALLAGYPTILYDVDPAMVEKGRSAIEKSLAILTKKNKLTREECKSAMDRLEIVHDSRACIADLIIEAVIERPDIKQALFHSLAANNKPDTIFASNTSSLSLDALAENIPGPERFAGMHFFN